MRQMITREQAAMLANLVRTVRPEWDSRLTTDQLHRLDAQLPELTAHALAVAGNDSNRTPAALTWTPLPSTRGAAPGPVSRELCRHCSRTERGCRNAQQNTGLDRHDFAPAGESERHG